GPDELKAAKENVEKAKVKDLVTIEDKDIFAVDMSKATVAALYLLEELNKKLVPQLQSMKEGSRVVTHDFPIPGYKPEKVETLKVDKRDHKVFFYTIPLKKAE